MPVLGSLQHLWQNAAFSGLNKEDEALVEVKLIQLVLLAKSTTTRNKKLLATRALPVTSSKDATNYTN